jgi:hypothetical protein
LSPLATEADLPVGSLHQFFSSQSVVIDASSG